MENREKTNLLFLNCRSNYFTEYNIRYLPRDLMLYSQIDIKRSLYYLREHRKYASIYTKYPLTMLYAVDILKDS